MLSKKLITALLALVIVVALVSLTACGSNEDLAEHPLVGSWNWDGNPLWQYVFHPDGSGIRGLPDETDSFSWSIRGDGHVRIDVDGGIREDWDYTISGERLTLDSRQVPDMSYQYIRTNE